jgi:hypothetical protein
MLYKVLKMSGGLENLSQLIGGGIVIKIFARAAQVNISYIEAAF